MGNADAIPGGGDIAFDSENYDTESCETPTASDEQVIAFGKPPAR